MGAKSELDARSMDSKSGIMKKKFDRVMEFVFISMDWRDKRYFIFLTVIRWLNTT